MMMMLVGCRDDGPNTLPPAVEPLSDVERAVRISVALRGVPPDPADVAVVRKHPEALPALVDAWLDDPLFGETVKDMYAEILDIRADTRPIVPAAFSLADVNEAAIFKSVDEAPLRLIEDVIMSDRPLQDLLSEEHVYADELLVRIYGLEGWDPNGPEVQPLKWIDGRPAAGVLSSSALWMRHESNGSNFNRGRANLVSDVFLCDNIGNRDVLVPGDVDLSDDEQVANEVVDNPACGSCHVQLDPLSAYFSGFKKTQHRIGIFMAHNTGCELEIEGRSPRDWCYPLEMYDVEHAEDWVGLLPEPAFLGETGSGLGDLGRQIGEDPRFAVCAARRFTSFLFQKELEEVPSELVEDYVDTLVSSGYDAKQLVKAIVLSDDFGAARVIAPARAPLATGLLIIRPEAYARWIADLTGFTWWAFGGCEGDESGCWPVVDLARSSLYGFQSMAGGTDGFMVTSPTHTATPTRVLVLNRLAAEGAGYVVEQDLAEADLAARRMLGEVDGTDAGVDRQIDAAWTRVFGEKPSREDRESLRGLYDIVADRDGETEAWKVVLTALFQDPRVVFY